MENKSSIVVDHYSAMVRQAKRVQRLAAKRDRAQFDLDAAVAELERMRVAAGLPEAK